MAKSRAVPGKCQNRVTDSQCLSEANALEAHSDLIALAIQSWLDPMDSATAGQMNYIKSILRSNGTQNKKASSTPILNHILLFLQYCFFFIDSNKKNEWEEW